MSDIQELKSEVVLGLKSDAVKAIEVALELAIDECLALEAGIISTLVNSEQRRTDLRRGHDFQPRIDSTLHADAKLTNARDRVRKLGAAISALKAGGWSQVDAPQIKSASCGDHGGALSASRDACPTCQSDASHQEHEPPQRIRSHARVLLW